MDNTVKVQVTKHHFKNQFRVGDKLVTRESPTEVRPNVTVRNAVQAGTLKLVEGSLSPSEDEKSFQGDEAGGEGVEEIDEPAETEKREDEEDLSGLTVDELSQRCEEQGLKKSGTKDELIERLKNSE